ncbi:LytTR family DNA-binding domain-containing protein [Spirosoma fluviale]|uniref:Transcriptional regulator, LytTR family n=1 Tax=Spirosoma fluviale TaxID=1597977 RepID=A0A286GCC1_9BACT|nr:transcriptional regulator, LytTR family [Spirosoma fluviale]
MMTAYPKLLFLMPTNSIIWLEGDGNYTRMHLQDGKYQSIPYTLKYIANKLPDFVRIHKSSLINPVYVQELTSRGYQDYWVKLSSGQVLSVSRKRIVQTATKLNLPKP